MLQNKVPSAVARATHSPQDALKIESSFDNAHEVGVVAVVDALSSLPKAGTSELYRVENLNAKSYGGNAVVHMETGRNIFLS